MRSTTLGEERRLAAELGIAIHLEQLLLDLPHLLASRLAALSLPCQDLLLMVEVAQVTGGDHAERFNELRIEVMLAFAGLRYDGLDDAVRDIAAVKVDRAHPGKVIETDDVNPDAIDLHPHGPGNLRLHPEGRITQAHPVDAAVTEQ